MACPIAVTSCGPSTKRKADLSSSALLRLVSIDTANVYSAGSSEEILGRALKEFARREEVVIATKVYFRMRPGPNGTGLSRQAILTEIDASLRRLGTDYVDLYQIHRWDYHTPIEETLEALHDVVKAGKARYIGASSMYAWQFAKALAVAERNGWTRFVSMQNYVNLLYREEEREMLPLCEAEGIGVIPWSPLARGRLTRDWDERSARSATDEFGKTLYAKSADADRKVVERVAEIAAKTGCTASTGGACMAARQANGHGAPLLEPRSFAISKIHFRHQVSGSPPTRFPSLRRCTFRMPSSDSPKTL
jgi:aryl-alcohol dehydrogenase-like predicted oxidoreductase